MDGTSPAARGSIVTSDEFIVDPDRLATFIARGVVAVDMETGAVAAAVAVAVEAPPALQRHLRRGCSN